jgi:RimJ/RimL family protein N-acetyltransferase
MPQYFLTTERIGFRSWSVDDLPLAGALWGDVDVSAYIGGPFSPEQVRDRLHREIECLQLHGVQYWPIFLLKNDAHMGCCGLRPYDLKAQVYELGFHVKKEFWGLGIATEAARGACDWAAKHLQPASLFAGHHPENAASKAALLKLGFVFTHDEPYGPTGLLHPSYRLLLHQSR